MVKLAPTVQSGASDSLDKIGDNTLKSLEFAITFLIQTLSHAKKKDNLSDFVNAVCNLLQNHVPTAQWFLSK